MTTARSLTRFHAKTCVTTLDVSACRAPVEVFRTLAAEGAMLMESAAHGSPGGTRSLVIPAGVVRLTAHGREVELAALSAQGARVVPALHDLPRIADDGIGPPSLPDHEFPRTRGASPTSTSFSRSIASCTTTWSVAFTS